MKRIWLAIVMVAVLFTGLGSIQGFSYLAPDTIRCAPIAPDIEMVVSSDCDTSCHTLELTDSHKGLGHGFFVAGIDTDIITEGQVTSHSPDCQCTVLVSSNIFSSTALGHAADINSVTNHTKPTQPPKNIACGIAIDSDHLGVSVAGIGQVG